MAEKFPPSILSDTAPSLQDTLEGYQEETGLVDREPAISSGAVASVTTLVTSAAIVLRHAYGVEIGTEVIGAIIDFVLVSVSFIAPLVASKFTRERVTPVN